MKTTIEDIKNFAWNQMDAVLKFFVGESSAKDKIVRLCQWKM